MFKSIRTSEENREIISKLTRKLNLGSENVIARIALVYSINQQCILDINDIEDYGGKEYSKNVLLGEFENYYLGLLSVKYNLHKTDKELVKLIKIHIDDGLKKFNEEVNNLKNGDGIELLKEKINFGVSEI